MGEEPIEPLQAPALALEERDDDGAMRRRLEVDAVLPPVRAAIASTPSDSMPERIEVDDKRDLIEPLVSPVVDEALPSPGGERREVGLLLEALGLIAGLLTMALELADNSRLVLMARLVLLLVGWSSLTGRALTVRPDPARPHRLIAVLAPLFGAAVAGWAFVLEPAAVATRATFLAGTILTVAAVNIWLVGLASRSVHAGRRWVEQRLSLPARRLVAETGKKEIVLDLKPGEQVVVEAGEMVPVDLQILEGEVEVLPWVGAATRVRRRAGDVLVAGGRVTQGHLRGVCTWAGDDRALARPLLAPARRADVHTQLPRLSRAIAERWSVLAAIVAAAAFALLGHGVLDSVMVAVAVYAACANVAVGTLSSLSIARGVRMALSRGVIVNDPAGWDRCTQVTAAVFCARGTLLRGEPELLEVEAFERVGTNVSGDEVLSLAAGALAAEVDPVSVAVRRAARDRGVSADPVRNARSFAGRGVVAVAATGESLCVGSRVLLLERKVSVAAAEQKIYELEALGRTVVLVARAGRLVGLLGLQDGLRAGARAAVQHLLDVKIEPVLMSADTRETCEALGRALDIDHLRPEMVEGERSAGVQRLRDTAGVVAVLGHTPYDDEALAAADVAVVLAAAGRPRDDFAVMLVSDDVRDASLALAVASRTRAHAAAALGLVLGPAALGALVVTLGMLPPEYAPLAQLCGALVAVWHLRALERT